MMLFRLSLRNLRRCIRDYAIYFFTLLIGVSIFYVFNAVNTQTAMVVIEDRSITKLLETSMSSVSVFVAFVLGLLIVYASRFLMKRRNREFALYLLLGMSKGKISVLLFFETLFIGIGSLAAGLVAGIGLSQLMSAPVVNLFEADMTSYHFIISTEAIGKTILNFGIMYLVVMICNGFMIGKCKLIDLLQSEKKTEKLHLKNMLFCTLLFFLAAFGLGYAYYQVCYSQSELTQEKFVGMTALGAVSTFVLFWSVSGLLMRIVSGIKALYFHKLNVFTIRQIGSRINTMVFSMTVICLMLFVTICALLGCFSIRNSLNKNLDDMCPVDVELTYYRVDEAENRNGTGLIEDARARGWDIPAAFADYTKLHCYRSEDFTFGDFFAESGSLDEVMDKYLFLDYSTLEDVFPVSEYNALMQLYGREQIELDEGEYVIIGNFDSMMKVRDMRLAYDTKMTIFGHELHSKYPECRDGFVELSVQPLNVGIFIVPDSVVEGQMPQTEYVFGNYPDGNKQEKIKSEKQFLADYTAFSEELNHISINSRQDMANASIGLGAIVAFIGLYIGLVFLVACGAILALKQLSETADSIRHYEMLRKIGVEERDISRSLFCQTGIFFLLPMLLAALHSYFGMKFAMIFLEMFGTSGIGQSMLTVGLLILLIYGGYFLVTYLCSKSMIREQK